MTLQRYVTPSAAKRKARNENARTVVDSVKERNMGERYGLFVCIKQMDDAASFPNHDRV